MDRIIAIGSDHAGFGLKREITAYFDEKGIKYKEIGCMNGESLDYPLVGKEMCELILSKKADLGVLVCGTGIGISMAANRFKGIRAAVCTNEYMAKYTRLHNDANILCLGGRVIGGGTALETVNAFLSNDFEGGRHRRRVDLIEN